MTRYPEHDKLSAVKDDTEVAAEFAEWLAGQGVQFMHWSEDLKDWHPVSAVCREPEGRYPRKGCTPRRSSEHCLHWSDDKETCCLCKRGQMQEVTLTGWVADNRSLMQLLADWKGVDLKAIEAEKRQMLDEIRTANEQA